MNLNLKQAVLAIAAASAFGASGLAAAAPVTLRLASVAPLKTVWVNQAERFAANVAESSKGDVKIELFPNAQLGTEQDVLQQVIRGRVDMLLVSAAGLSSQESAAMVPNLYFFLDESERDCVLDEHLITPMRELLAAKNLHLIGWYEVGSSGFAGKRKITSPADLKNLKIAYSPNKFATEFWKHFGAVPVATPAPEWASSLGAGLTDGAASPPVYYVAAGVSKVAPVWTVDVPKVLAPAMLVINKGVWDKLSAEQRAAITDANAKVPAKQIRQEVKAFEQVMIKKHQEAGGQVVYATPEEMAEWKKPMDALYDAAMKDVGPAAVSLLAKARAAKAACKK